MIDLYNNKFAKKEQRKTKIASPKMGVIRVIMLMFMVIGVWHDASLTPKGHNHDMQKQEELLLKENTVFEIIESAKKQQNIDTQQRIMSFRQFIDIILSEEYENSDDKLILQIKHASNPFFSFLSNYTTEEALRWLFSQDDFNIEKIKSSKLSQNIKDFIILCKANVLETLRKKFTDHEHGNVAKNPYNKIELTGFHTSNYLSDKISYKNQYFYYAGDNDETNINFFDDIEGGDFSKKTEYLFLTSTEIDSFKENSKRRANLKRRLLKAKEKADYLFSLSKLNLDKLNTQIIHIDRLIKYLEFTPFRIPNENRETWEIITQIKNDQIDYPIFFMNFNRRLDEKIDQIYLDLDEIYIINNILNNALKVTYITINSSKNTKDTKNSPQIISAANSILDNDNLKKISSIHDSSIHDSSIHDSSIDAINNFKNAVIGGIISEIFHTAQALRDALISSKNPTNQDNIDPIIEQINSFIYSSIFDESFTDQISAPMELDNIVIHSTNNNLSDAINEIKNNAIKGRLQKDMALAAIRAINSAINNSKKFDFIPPIALKAIDEIENKNIPEIVSI